MRLPVVVGCVLGAVVFGAGCVDRSGGPPPDGGVSSSPVLVSPSSTSVPTTMIEAEALAAYAAYTVMLDDTARAGGYDIVDDGEGARPRSVLATTMGGERDYVDGEKQELKRNHDKQVAGQRTIVTHRVRELVRDPRAPGGRRIELYACYDQSTVKYQGPKGSRTLADPYMQQWPTMLFDTEDPRGWKVAEMKGQGAKSC